MIALSITELDGVLILAIVTVALLILGIAWGRFPR